MSCKEKVRQNLSWHESQVRSRQREYNNAKERVLRSLDEGLLLDAKDLIDLELLPAQSRLSIAETELLAAQKTETTTE